MKNWKTTLSGLLGALSVIANNVFGLNIPVDAILTVTVFFVALFSKDSQVTGGSIKQ